MNFKEEQYIKKAKEIYDEDMKGKIKTYKHCIPSKISFKVEDKKPLEICLGVKGKKFYEGVKYDSDKPRFDLLPADALEEVAKVYAVGAKEYGDRNWERGMNYGRLFRALMSHAWAWWRGERDDKKNKLHHLTSVVFNALALLHYELNSEKFKKFDDRKE